jgi:hypothetical protein
MELDRIIDNINEHVNFAESKVAEEKLSGNLAKEEYWKGELTAYLRMFHFLHS